MLFDNGGLCNSNKPPLKRKLTGRLELVGKVLLTIELRAVLYQHADRDTTPMERYHFMFMGFANRFGLVEVEPCVHHVCRMDGLCAEQIAQLRKDERTAVVPRANGWCFNSTVTEIILSDISRKRRLDAYVQAFLKKHCLLSKNRTDDDFLYTVMHGETGNRDHLIERILSLCKKITFGNSSDDLAMKALRFADTITVDQDLSVPGE